MTFSYWTKLSSYKIQIYEYSWSNALGHVFLIREVRSEKTLHLPTTMTVSLPFVIMTSDTDPLAEDRPPFFVARVIIVWVKQEGSMEAPFT